jgi:hypothetical protein
VAILDIRDDEDKEIDVIIFASANDNGVAYQLVAPFKHTVAIENSSRAMYIKRSDIPNLIKALQKAQEIWKE